MNIGLMGGTFNPIHYAHLRIAEEARKAARLDTVVFIPAADPPHKALAGDVPFGHRWQMVQLAIFGKPYFEISGVEGERGGKSYSIDTIQAFREQFPGDKLFFIIGGDSYLEIGLWHRFSDIFQSCNLVVVDRPGSRIVDPLDSLPVSIRGNFRHDAANRRLLHDSGHTVMFIQGSPLEISSTAIRRLAASGNTLDHLVPPDVAAYISQQRIYQQCQ